MGKIVKAAVVGAAIATGVGLVVGSVATGSAFAIGGTTLFSAGTVGAYFARQLVISAVMGVVSKAFSPKPSSLTTAEDLRGRTIMARNPIASRTLIYGQVKTSGAIVFMETANKDKDLHYCVTLSSNELTAVDEVYFNDQLVNSNLSDNVQVAVGGSTPDYSSVAKITAHFGSPNQVADANLVSETSATVDHKFRGIAYIYAKCTYDQSKFGGGTPNISAVVKGTAVYDPRTSTTAYSNNAALCIRDYLMNTTYGLGATSAEINDAAFITAANICDENVTLADGSTEKRYTINGIVDTAKSPAEILDDMMTACQGSLYYSNGKWHLKVGAYITPTVTLDEDDVVGAISIQTRNSGQDQFNAVKGVFVSPDSNWQPTDFPEVTSTVFETEDGGERKYVDINMPFTTSPTMAQRIAKTSLYRNREQLVVSMACKLTAFQFEIGDTVMINNTRMGFVNKPFEVVAWNFEMDNSGSVVVNLVLKETSAAIYQWNANTDERQFTFNNTSLPTPAYIAAPGVTATNSVSTSGQSAIAVLSVTATSSNPFLSGFQVQVRKKGTSTWVSV